MAGGGGQAHLRLQFAEQGFDGGPDRFGEAVLHADRQHLDGFGAASLVEVVGGPEGQLGHPRFQPADHLVVAVGGALRRHREGMGAIEQQGAGGAQGRQVELAALDRAAAEVGEQPAHPGAGPKGDAPVVEELGVGAGLEAPAIPTAGGPAGPGQVAPEQVGHHGRIIQAGVAKGQQQPAFPGLELFHRPLQPPDLLHLNRPQAPLAQPQRQEQPGPGHHPAIELGRDELQRGGTGHRRGRTLGCGGLRLAGIVRTVSVPIGLVDGKKKPRCLGGAMG